MNTKQPRIYSEAEYERFIGALWLNTKLKGGHPKTYEAYVKNKTESIKWEEGMLAWNTERKWIIIFDNSWKLFKNWETTLQPPTQEQLNAYNAPGGHAPGVWFPGFLDGKSKPVTPGNDEVHTETENLIRCIDALREIKFEVGHLKCGRYNKITDQIELVWSITSDILDLLDAESTSDPANTCSPFMASPADVEEFLEEHKKEKESEPSHKYKAKDTVIWDGVVHMDDGPSDSDPCTVRIIEVLSTSSMFDYRIKHFDWSWAVYANQLTPVPGEKLFKVDNIVVFGITNALGKIINIYHEDGNSYVRLANGEKRVWAISDLVPATPEQVDEFYTATIDGEPVRLYSHSDHNGKYIRAVHGKGAYTMFFENGFGWHLIKHYNLPVLMVEREKDMIAPTKGDE